MHIGRFRIHYRFLNKLLIERGKTKFSWSLVKRFRNSIQLYTISCSFKSTRYFSNLLPDVVVTDHSVENLLIYSLQSDPTGYYCRHRRNRLRHLTPKEHQQIFSLVRYLHIKTYFQNWMSNQILLYVYRPFLKNLQPICFVLSFFLLTYCSFSSNTYSETTYVAGITNFQ